MLNSRPIGSLDSTLRIAPSFRPFPLGSGQRDGILARSPAPCAAGALMALRFVTVVDTAQLASLGATRGGSDGSTRKTRAGTLGSHQFQRPISRIIAGTMSARITVASTRIPVASAVGKIFTSVPGPD